MITFIYSKLNFGCSFPVSACNSPVPTWKLSKYVKGPPTGSPKTSPKQAFGLRWKQCNISLKTSMDHQLPVSTISISAALAVSQEETPQWMSGVIIIRNPFYSHSANSNGGTHCASIRDVWSLNNICWSRWKCWLHAAAVLFMVRVWDAAGRCVCCCCFCKQQFTNHSGAGSSVHWANPCRSPV